MKTLNYLVQSFPKTIFIAYLLILITTFQVKAGNSWSSKKDFGGGARAWATGFMIGNKGYIGTGAGGTKDFWEYDVSSNTWTQKADFGGGVRTGAVGFSIGNKGFIGTGSSDGYLANNHNDFWEYDPSSNSWAQKTNYPGGYVSGAVGFSIEDKGYIGTGEYLYGTTHYYNTFYEYDTASDSWSQKANFGGNSRSGAVGFSIGLKGYIGTGFDGQYEKNDFWEYDPSTNKWTQKANFNGTARTGAVGFSIGSKGYIGTGCDIFISTTYSDFSEYNPFNDSWTKKTSYGYAVGYGVGFSNCTNGFISTGTGTSSSSTTSKYLEEYTPSVVPGAAYVASKTDLCEGDCITFTDSSTNAPTSWDWTFNGGSPSSSTYQNLSSVCFKTAGTYKITLVASNDRCTSTATQNIKVESPPTLSISPSAPVICSGGNVQLYAFGADTYSWSPSTGLSATTGDNVKSSPSSTLTYTVTGKTSIGCINIAQVKVTVVPNPVVTVSPVSKTICEGESLSITAGGATSYFWTPSSDLSSSTAATVTANPLITTSYTVTGTDNNGCFNTATSTITVTPLPHANAGIDVSICKGKSVTLKASGGSSYSWYPTTGLSNPNISNPSVTPNKTITYSVTVKNGSCKPDSDAMTITVNPLPDTPVISANGTTLSSSATSGNNWFLNGNSIPSANSQFYTMTQSGFYTVCTTNSSGCTSCSLPFSYSGINDRLQANDFEIYPNPSNGKFTIELSDIGQKTQLTVYNILGVKIYNSVINDKKTEIVISSMAKGSYFVEIQNENGVYIKKIELE